MDYEKKYKEALGWMQSVYPIMTGAVKEDAEHYFPELKESEDEKIRKAIYNCVKWFGFDSCFFKDVSQEECLAWLERQGEQKPTIEIKSAEESLGIDSETYSKVVDECIYGEQKPTKGAKGNDREIPFSEQEPVLIIPKFRVGDEIKTSNEESLTITKIDKKGYWSEDLFICGFGGECLWDLVEQKPADKIEPKFKKD